MKVPTWQRRQQFRSHTATVEPEVAVLQAKLEEQVHAIASFTGPEDFVAALGAVARLLERSTPTQLRQLVVVSNVYIDSLNAVFGHPIVIEAVRAILAQEKELFDIEKVKGTPGIKIYEKRALLNVAEKKMIYAALSLATFPLAVVAPHIAPQTVVYIRARLKDAVKYLVHQISDEYTTADACFRLAEIMQSSRYVIRDKLPGYYDLDFLFRHLGLARGLIGSMLTVLPQHSVLSGQMMKAMQGKAETDQLQVTKELDKIHKAAYKIQASLASFQQLSAKGGARAEDLSIFMAQFQSRSAQNALYFVERMTSGFHFQTGKTLGEVVLNKFNQAPQLLQEFQEYAQQHFLSFQRKIDEDDKDWSNKIFIISCRTLAVLNATRSAIDERWKIGVATHEYAHWLHHIHRLFNKYRLEDDWDRVAELVAQETDRIEWKSSFYTATEAEPLPTPEAEAGRQRSILQNVVKNILGMLNTSGGTIVVGLVESPDDIVRVEVRQQLVHKNDRTFFNVQHELKQLNKDIDIVRNEIQDQLSSLTLLSPDKFNDLWEVEPIEISDGLKRAEIYLITVQKAARRIFNAEKNNGDNIWITLTVRANGRTIQVDPREYLLLEESLQRGVKEKRYEE